LARQLLCIRRDDVARASKKRDRHAPRRTHFVFMSAAPKWDGRVCMIKTAEWAKAVVYRKNSG